MRGSGDLSAGLWFEERIYLPPLKEDRGLDDSDECQTPSERMAEPKSHASPYFIQFQQIIAVRFHFKNRLTNPRVGEKFIKSWDFE